MTQHTSNNKTDAGYAAILTILAFLFLYFFSIAASPKYGDVAFDANIFNVIGREWANGGLPYVTIWDSKGPWIFFTNMLGYKLTGSVRGVFVIEIINLVATLLVTFYMLRKYFSGMKSFLFTLAYFAAFAITFCDGNQVSEYSTLFAVPATLMAYRWSRGWNDGRAAHPWQYALVYGLFFGASLMSRATNALPLIVWTAIIFFVLVANKLWNNLLKNVAAFLAGVAVFFVPFAIYFAAHGAFGEMWYAMITYNFEYTNVSETFNVFENKSMYIIFFFYFCSTVSAFVYGLAVMIAEKKKGLRFGMVWALAGGLTTLWLLNSYASNFYAITYAPMILIPLIDIDVRKGERIPKLAAYLAIALVIAGFANFLRYFYKYVRFTDQSEQTLTEVKMAESVPDGDTFVAYNSHPYLYLATGKRPCYRFFVCQDWAIKNGPSLRQKVVDTYSTRKAEWILVNNVFETTNIDSILNNDYKVVSADKKHKLRLFKLKDNK